MTLQNIDFKKFISHEYQRPRSTRDFTAWTDAKGVTARQRSMTRTNYKLEREHYNLDYYPPLLPPSMRNLPTYDPLDIKFKSARELVDLVRDTPGRPPACRDNMDPEWNWNVGVDAAIKIFDSGWSEGLDAVRYDMNKAIDAAISKAMEGTDLDRNVTGSFIDVDAYVNGDPLSMWDFVERDTDVLQLDLDIDTFVWSEIESYEVMNRGIAIMAAILALKRIGCVVKANWSFEVKSWSWASNLRFQKHKMSFPILSPGLTENLSEVMFILGHPAFFRSIALHAMHLVFGLADPHSGILSRTADDFKINKGSGKVIVPGIFPEVGDLGHDFGMRWTDLEASVDLVGILMQCAAPARR